MKLHKTGIYNHVNEYKILGDDGAIVAFLYREYAPWLTLTGASDPAWEWKLERSDGTSIKDFDVFKEAKEYILNSEAI